MAVIIDQTRSDHYSFRSSLKKFIKGHDYFHFFSWCSKQRYHILWEKDRVKRKLFTSCSLTPVPYIIRRGSSNVGLFSYFITVLGGIAYAYENGYTPVVDMKNYPNAYLYDDEVGRINSWEYYFEQPGVISLEEALRSRKYILGRDTSLHSWPSDSIDNFYNKNGQLDYWRNICKKYIRFAPAVTERLENLKAEHSGKKILGVLVRGTDYVSLRPSGHPIPPTAEQAIEKTKNKGSHTDRKI